MHTKTIKNVLILALIILMTATVFAGCGGNDDGITEKISDAIENNNSDNIIPSDEEISESILYSYMQFYYRYAYNNKIDVPIFKERKKVADYVTKTNFTNNQDKLIFVDCDAGYFKGDCYTMTLGESEYSYWGELNDEGKPDGIGMVCRAFTDLSYEDPELLILYIGEFRDGYYDGYGVQFNFPDIYNDYPNIIFSQINEENIGFYNDPIYEGYFKEGKYSGQGVEIICNIGGVNVDTGELLLDRDKADYYLFVGEYKNGELDGNAKIYEHKGVLEYEGQYSDGEYNGKGTLYFVDNPGKIKYEGEFSGGLYHGEGTLYDEAGKTIYSGKFSCGDVA